MSTIHYLDLHSRGHPCIENMEFVTLRRLKGDFSVVQSYYMQTSQALFNSTITLHELAYSGNVVPAGPHEDPAQLIFSHVREDKLEDALSTSLGDVNTITSNRATNYYVAYAAIDLMNFKYTQIDSDKVVRVCKNGFLVVEVFCSTTGR